jgi:hypothetical protein
MCSLLVTSAMLSHQLLYDEQMRKAQDHRGLDVRTSRMRSRSRRAHVLLWMGKLLAICNGWWLIVSTLFELCGFYSTCFCYSSWLGLRGSAWVVLWKNDADLRELARPYWITGIILAGVVWLISIGILVIRWL